MGDGTPSGSRGGAPVGSGGEAPLEAKKHNVNFALRITLMNA